MLPASSFCKVRCQLQPKIHCDNISAVQDTFHNERHQLLNKALPGTTSAYVSPCALQMVPPNADFVLLEFTFNDAERASTAQAADDPTR